RVAAVPKYRWDFWIRRSRSSNQNSVCARAGEKSGSLRVQRFSIRVWGGATRLPGPVGQSTKYLSIILTCARDAGGRHAGTDGIRSADRQSAVSALRSK